MRQLGRFSMALFCASLMSAQQRSLVTIHVDAARVENHVSPRMYAAFVEMMAEDVKRGMTAEMMLDRSFEAPTDYLGLPAHWQMEPDERNDSAGAIHFQQTADEAYPKTDEATLEPNHSLRITLSPGDIKDERRGLSQGKLSILAGEMYKGYVWAKVPRNGGYAGHVRVALEEDNTDGRSYAEATLSGIAGDWHQYAFTLTPTTSDRFSKLSLLFDGHGTLFLDQISLEAASARTQVRADSEAMIAGLHPSFLRWPGGNVAQDYHWQWGIGPRDLRPVWINKAWSNAPEPDDLGTDEYLAFCERLHIDPSITVNVNGSGATPEEAAAWVQYVNGSASSKYGAMRAANGHPEPYGVRQWELGNEIFGDWVRGHDTAEHYAAQAVMYAKAMRAVDPQIQLIAVGEGIFPNSDAWNTAVLKTAGEEIQYLAIHDYAAAGENAAATDPRVAMMARATEFEANYRHIGDLIQQQTPGRNIKLIVNEWNLFYGVSVIQSMEGAVYASRLMNGFERDGDIVDSNCISDLLNGWLGGVIQASRDRVYGTAEYYALKLYSDHLGTQRLHTDIASPSIGGAKSVDAIATKSADGKTIYVKLSNAEAMQKAPTTISFDHFRYATQVEAEVLSAAAPGDRNSFSDPTRLSTVKKTIDCSKTCTLVVEPDSVAVLTFHARN